MLLLHITLAVLALGLAARQKTLTASIVSFIGACASGVFMATTSGWTLHGATMLGTFAIIYGVIAYATTRSYSHQK